ncbi:hypothetical protein EJ04DRAFT_600794 [Polyplosphaeria fusca]|uniref:beta-glucosidase n=1 Tax=Polyplosphaeria fusca TaxID=682080 RepID=A0A9P4R9E0_9PLEO|nr:hypothetical protein EJ04DRAFT_600794 [Polyplosphaeria fusca]
MGYTTSADVDKILKSLSLEEKISLLAGKDFWETVAIPSKGVPPIKTTDGPNGARGAFFSGGTSAACFPAAVCSAATWNPALSRQVGNALAEEALTKGARVLLGPTACNHRHPLGGRNFESFSEDPVLSGTLAAQVVRGLQERGVAATVKHFVANEQETDRLTVNEIISERALREVYMKPFEMIVKEANPWAIMTSYNKINGIHADSNPFLLERVLRGEWNWKGLVMSDWGGTNSVAESLKAGLDLEMPGPARLRTIDAVTKAVKEALVSRTMIDCRVRNLFELMKKIGAFENPDNPPERSVDDPAHQQLIREVAGQGIVLLKNENNILPMTKENVKGKKIALLGLAKDALIHGGGSASLQPHHKISPWHGLCSAYGDTADFQYAKGAHTYRQLPPLVDHCVDSIGGNGWTFEIFDKGKQIPSSKRHGFRSASFNPLSPEVSVRQKSICLSSTYAPAATGSHYLSLSGIGPTKVFINDDLVFEQTEDSPDAIAFFFGGGDVEEELTFPFTKGQLYRIRIESSPPTGNHEPDSILAGLPGCRLGFMEAEEHDQDLLASAVDTARRCDFAIVFTGHTHVWETEGQDQASFNLPRDGSQDRLVDAVASANPNTIVVNSTGVAVALPWLFKVQAMVQAWFPGQEAGHAIADVLSGSVNPSGRLPISWPKRIEDAPAYGNFPGVKEDGQRTVRYDEGVFVGYRHYDRISPETVHFPFGFGLSYTAFMMKYASVTRDSESRFNAKITVTNVGPRTGATVVQLYVGRTLKSPNHPIKTLAAFQKVFMESGASEVVEISVSLKDFAYFDEASGSWKVDRGEYDFSFAQDAVRVESVVTLHVEGSRTLKL